MIDINEFGQKLRAEREKQGYNLEDVAEGTRIRKLYLNALEEDDFDQLPPRVYATGFVATYARFLKMDAEAMVEDFKAHAYPIQIPQPSQPHVKAVKKKVRKRIRKKGGTRKIPGKNIFAALLFLVVIWWLGSYMADYIAQQGVSKQQAEMEIATTPTVAEAGPNNAVVNPAPDRLRLVIAAQQSCWLQVTVDGADKYTGTMTAGEQQSFEARESIIVKVGNAGGIELTLNDKKLAPLGELGQVVEKKYDMSSISKE